MEKRPCRRGSEGLVRREIDPVDGCGQRGVASIRPLEDVEDERLTRSELASLLPWTLAFDPEEERHVAKLGFCGLGQMGTPMAGRLIDVGHDVTVWNRTASKARALVERGAGVASTPAEAAAGTAFVFTMLSTPDVVDEVVFGKAGVAEGLGSGSTLVEMSTIGPEAVHGLRAKLPPEIDMLDAPVLGSVAQAESGELKVFVGGERPVAVRARSVLEAFGAVRHLGRLGAGASMKLVVNSTILALMAALGEALALADSFGLDQDDVLDILADSAIGVSARGKRQRIESGAYPPNFKLSLAAKDGSLVTRAAEAAGLNLEVARAAAAWMVAADRAGLGDLDYSAVIAQIRGMKAGP
jgi:3-hydroxyisobutyrate dehydrogenase-like beta-hydroxyacid dehydrogenase